MSDRELVRLALWDAVAWQESLADAHHKDDPWHHEALKQAKQYRAVLKKRYADTKSANEIFYARSDVVNVTLDELRHNPSFGHPLQKPNK